MARKIHWRFKVHGLKVEKGSIEYEKNIGSSQKPLKEVMFCEYGTMNNIKLIMLINNTKF